MVKEKYVPDYGDIIFIDFNPTIGREQKGPRPALVLSSKSLNAFTGLAIVCPITNTIRDYKWHIKLSDSQKTTGVIMCEQIKTIDYRIRNCQFKETLEKGTLKKISDIIKVILNY